MAVQLTWQPEPEQMGQLVRYLKDALSGHDQNAQMNATMVEFSSLKTNITVEAMKSTMLTYIL